MISEEREPNHAYQLFSHLFYDAEGNEYEIHLWTSGLRGETEEGYFGEEFPLKDFWGDEVWLSPIFLTFGLRMRRFRLL